AELNHFTVPVATLAFSLVPANCSREMTPATPKPPPPLGADASSAASASSSTTTPESWQNGNGGTACLNPRCPTPMIEECDDGFSGVWPAPPSRFSPLAPAAPSRQPRSPSRPTATSLTASQSP